MTDVELAMAFFTRLKERGYPIEIDHHAYGQIEDLNDPHFICFDVQDDNKEIVFQFDFYPDGAFHRIAGFDRAGGWRDELDWRKY